MGTISFLVPDDAPKDWHEALRRACIAGGYDHSPIPTIAELHNNQLFLRREIDESGYLQAPWEVESVGRFMGTTATLMERQLPYHMLIELARGKVNQVRNQKAEWESVGLQVPSTVSDRIRKAVKAFGQSLLAETSAERNTSAMQTLTLAYHAADDLIQLYVEQLFALRHQRAPKLDTSFGCRLSDLPIPAMRGKFQSAFNTVCVPCTWRAIEPNEANYQWEACDRSVDWALASDLSVTAGPLIDFSPMGLPDWLKVWENDLPSIASFMCDYIETVITRYKSRIRRWVVSTGSNLVRMLHLSEEDLIRLTARLAEAAWGIDSGLEVVVGLAQPWGEYLATGQQNYSPFVFADTLLWAQLPFASFELEWHMAVSPQGSYCRDRLDASRLLDMFGLLGVPIQVSLSYPSAEGHEPNADATAMAGRNGNWHGISPQAQADWAEAFASLAVCKTHVCGVYWNHFSDRLPHSIPHGGLVAGEDIEKPALARLAALKDAHLRSSNLAPTAS